MTKLSKALQAQMKAMDRLKVFRPYAKEIVMETCTKPDGSKMTKDYAQGIIEAMTIDMATGAELMKGKYMLQGAAMTFCGLYLYGVFKELKKEGKDGD